MAFVAGLLSRPLTRPLLAVFLIALAARLAYCAYASQGPNPFQDRYREYIIVAQGLVEHGAFLSPLVIDGSIAPPSGLMPPLYAFWVAGIYGLLGVESWAATLVLQFANALAGSLACIFVFKIAETIDGWRAAWIASLFFALNPAVVAYTNYIWDTSFFVLAVALSLWLTLRLRQSDFVPWKYVAFGSWLGLVALLNPALTLTYPFLVLFALRADVHFFRKPVGAGTGAVLIGWLIAIAPWSIRNYIQIGSISYVRIGIWNEVWLGVAPEADKSNSETFRKNYPLLNPREARKITELGEREYFSERGRLARKQIAGDPGRFATLCLTRALNFWLGTVITPAGMQGDIIPATRQRQLLMGIFLAEMGAIIFGIVRRRLRSPEPRWLLLIATVFSLIYCATHVQVRFRVPIESIFAVLVGLSLAGRAKNLDTSYASDNL